MLRYRYVLCYFVLLHDVRPEDWSRLLASVQTFHFLILLSCGFSFIIVKYDWLMEYIFRNTFTTTDLRIVCWAASKDQETPTHSVRDPAVMFYDILLSATTTTTTSINSQIRNCFVYWEFSLFNWISMCIFWQKSVICKMFFVNLNLFSKHSY